MCGRRCCGWLLLWLLLVGGSSVYCEDVVVPEALWDEVVKVTRQLEVEVSQLRTEYEMLGVQLQRERGAQTLLVTQLESELQQQMNLRKSFETSSKRWSVVAVVEAVLLAVAGGLLIWLH